MNISKLSMVVAIAALCLYLSSCSKSDGSFDFKTDSLLRITFSSLVNDANMPGLAGIAYNPVAVKKSGDTLFIANRADGADGVIILQASTGKLIKALTGWTYNGAQEVFDKQVMDVEVTPELILVVNRSSRIDIFKRKDYSYVTTIGTGKWQTSALLECESAVVAGDKIFIRDKQKIQVVQLKDCTPENRFKVPVYASNADSTKSNNGFGLESVAAYKGQVYVTDYVSYKIFVLNPDGVKGNDAPFPFVRSMKFASRPLAMTFYKGYMFVTCSNKSIVKVDPATGTVVDTFTSFTGGVAWDTPGRILIDGKDLFLTSSSQDTPSLRKGEMTYVEFTHFD